MQSFRQGFGQLAENGGQINRDDAMVMDSPAAETASGDSASSKFTTTYTLEGVDDDAVKYDGNHLFIAPSRSMDCCFIVEPLPVEEDIAIASDALMVPEGDSAKRSAAFGS